VSIHSKNKGKRGEREAAKELRFHLGDETIRRGQQSKGGPDSPDVRMPDDLHPEIKFSESANIYKAMEQAVRDGRNKVPFVMHKKKYKPWLITVRSPDLLVFKEDIIAVRNRNNCTSVVPNLKRTVIEAQIARNPNVYDMLIAATKKNEVAIPIAMHSRDGREWLVTFYASHLIAVCQQELKSA
jgi:hypothetical protein